MEPQNPAQITDKVLLAIKLYISLTIKSNLVVAIRVIGLQKSLGLSFGQCSG